MENQNKKTYLILGVLGVVCFIVIFFIVSLVGGNSKEQSNQVVGENADTMSAEAKLQSFLDRVEVSRLEARKGNVSLEKPKLEDELPEIEKYPLSVEGDGEINIEIFSSPEKAGSENDGWLIEVAEAFNKENFLLDGKKVSVSIRNIASGMGMDYIISGKYVPDAFTPSNELWGEMILAEGGKVSLAKERLVGNVAGILLKKEKYDSLVKKYGAINMKTITQATAENEVAMGYTNPLASSTGLNFLLSTLYAYDSGNLLSEVAAKGFDTFQKNVPFVSYTTMQMRDAVESGSLDALILEYQTYVNTKELKDYVFTPFGVRHDNPMYAVGDLTKEKSEVLQKFIDFCLNDNNQQLASQYGFNKEDSYVAELPKVTGDTLIDAQDLWKDNKDQGRPVAAVFVADISGSMDGDPITQLKESLLNGSKYINEENYIGLVSYNSSVYINLPIKKFDLNQRSYFTGAVEDLNAAGGTATFDAITVALNMLMEAKEASPDTKLMVFVLSDGETNTGIDLSEIESLVKELKVPIYTIGYNANIEALKVISQINEAASINADSDDVIYKLKSLFNAQM